jgi:hypothetical protein
MNNIQRLIDDCNRVLTNHSYSYSAPEDYDNKCRQVDFVSSSRSIISQIEYQQQVLLLETNLQYLITLRDQASDAYNIFLTCVRSYMNIYIINDLTNIIFEYSEYDSPPP